MVPCDDDFVNRSQGPSAIEKAHEGCLSSCHFSKDGKLPDSAPTIEPVLYCIIKYKSH